MGQGFALFANVAPEVLRAAAREAEALGYTSFWVNHPGKFDGLAALAGPARETQRIDLGIGVIPLHTRPPADIAEGAQTNSLPQTRLLLGVGSPNPQSLKRVRDGVAELRAKLSCRIGVAALGPKMCHLAGEVADGVLFNWLTPEYARRSADLVRAGATAAGRPAPMMIAYVRVAIGPAAGERLAEEAARYTGVPAYNAHFVRMGVKALDTGIAVQTPAAVAPALRTWQGAVDELVVRSITAKDGLEETLELVRAAKPA
ncbi:MAG TPA: LLM class flavin-dependent oxidoreductase [Candidatus Limnocylindrales bacterium]|nr:LLM class flavin-dependent oxidoreductase [Candidatus Limnocylindrales bacterium]